MRRLKIRALEKNILKYRAIDSILCMHYAENLSKRIYNSFNETSRILNFDDEIKKNKCFKKLEKMKLISSEESEELKKLIDFRNIIAHEFEKNVLDITSPNWSISTLYNYSARARLKKWNSIMWERLGEHHILMITVSDLTFAKAEKVYEDELHRLKKKIDRQFKERYNTV